MSQWCEQSGPGTVFSVGRPSCLGAPGGSGYQALTRGVQQQQPQPCWLGPEAGRGCRKALSGPEQQGSLHPLHAPLPASLCWYADMKGGRQVRGRMWAKRKSELWELQRQDALAKAERLGYPLLPFPGAGCVAFVVPLLLQPLFLGDTDLVAVPGPECPLISFPSPSLPPAPPSCPGRGLALSPQPSPPPAPRPPPAQSLPCSPSPCHPCAGFCGLLLTRLPTLPPLVPLPSNPTHPRPPPSRFHMVHFKQCSSAAADLRVLLQTGLPSEPSLPSLSHPERAPPGPPNLGSAPSASSLPALPTHAP